MYVSSVWLASTFLIGMHGCVWLFTHAYVDVANWRNNRYPNLLKAFGYYRNTYNVTSWQLPFKVHETYDAVPQTPSARGEGNHGYSLYNAVNYLVGLRCMAAFAELMDDTATLAQAQDMLQRASASIQVRSFVRPCVRPSSLSRARTMLQRCVSCWHGVGNPACS